MSPSYSVWFSLGMLQPKSNAIQKEQTCKPPFQRKMGLWSSWLTVESEATQTHTPEHVHLHGVRTAAGLTTFLSLSTARVTWSFFSRVDHVKSWKHQFTQADKCPWLPAFCAVTGFVWSLGTVRKSKELPCSDSWDNGGFKLASVFALHRRYISQQPLGWLALFLFLSYVLQHLGTRGVWYRDQAKIFHIR